MFLTISGFLQNQEHPMFYIDNLSLGLISNVLTPRMYERVFKHIVSVLLCLTRQTIIYCFIVEKKNKIF